MKTKVSAVIIIIFLSAIITGCKKDFLEVTPQGAIIYQQFFKTKTDALEALTGVYNALGFEVNAVGVAGYDWCYGDIASDDATKGGENPADSPDIYQIQTFTVNGGDDLLVGSYQYLYMGIVRANILLINVPNITDSSLTPGLKDRIMAEAKFLRAYYYFRLNIIFNGVPLVTNSLTQLATSTLNPSLYKIPRATPAQIWAQVESDLTDAIPYLPLKNGTDANKEYNPSVDMGRATQGAAQALLAKAYIFEKKWSLAKSMCEQVMNSGQYDLEPDFRNNFKYQDPFKNGIESVFEIQQGTGFNYNYNPPYNYANGDMGTGINVFQTPRGLGGYGFDIPTKSLFNEFEQGDLRRKATIARVGDTIDGVVFSSSLVYQQDTLAPVKYSLQRTDWASADSDGPSDVKIIRFADVLLWHAEACAQLGDVSAGFADLRKIRNRAGLTNDYPSNLLNAVYHERRVELALEGHRFYDLVRTGRAYSVLQAAGRTNFIAGKNEYFPIPNNEINLSNGILVQNPGY